MNWVLVFIIVRIAGGDRAVNVTTIPMETEKLCIEGSDKLQKSYQETNAASCVRFRARLGMYSSCFRCVIQLWMWTEQVVAGWRRLPRRRSVTHLT